MLTLPYPGPVNQCFRRIQRSLDLGTKINGYLPNRGWLVPQRCSSKRTEAQGKSLSTDLRTHMRSLGFPVGSDGKEAACNVGDLGSVPRLGRSSRGGYGNPLQCSHLENPHRQRSLAGHSTWGHKEVDRTERLCTAQHMRSIYGDPPQKLLETPWP